MCIVYDIAVVGAGHAGVEASLSCAKMCKKTILITMSIEQICTTSCNPAIGGLAKGHIVREIDALGGEMAKCTDKTGIQFRVLNASKGAAVQGSRAQIDMDMYKAYMKNTCLTTENLTVYQDEVININLKDGLIEFIQTKLGLKIYARKFILTTGTFLKGKIHVGQNTFPAGRAWEKPASRLSDSLTSLNINLKRFKTGTPARITANSINFDKLERHEGDSSPRPLSFQTNKKTFEPKQYPCYIAYTNKTTHKIIENNLSDAPLFSGQIQGVGPRYCPSIEDKVYRFSDRDRHQLFLEPHTKEENEYYINGLSSSLSVDIQDKVIKSIVGLENATITRYGYAIEYDYIDTTILTHALCHKDIRNLYFAGQINGTTGYEEAAAQGLMAGINASLSCEGKEALVLRRDEAYIGVLIDDLVTKGTDEPYRMFTSRAEYRLLLREETADIRLSGYGHKYGLIDDKTYTNMTNKKHTINNVIDDIQDIWFNPNKENLKLLNDINEDKISDKTKLIDIIGRSSITKEKFDIILPVYKTLDDYIKNEIITYAKYYRYIQKQHKQIEKMKNMINLKIPDSFTFVGLAGLSNEVIEKLNHHRPKNLFDASQISGITPSAVDILHLNISKRSKNV